MAAHIDPEFHPPERPLAPSLALGAWIAPSADVMGDVRLGANASVWFGAVLRGDLEPVIVGDGTNIQDLALCHVANDQPCVVGANCTIGHKAVLHACEIGDGCLIGIGALVLSGAKIGAESIVAAGAVVPEGMVVPPRSMVMGLPAKVKRPLSDAEAALGANIATKYSALAQAHRHGFYRPADPDHVPTR